MRVSCTLQISSLIPAITSFSSFKSCMTLPVFIGVFPTAPPQPSKFPAAVGGCFINMFVNGFKKQMLPLMPLTGKTPAFTCRGTIIHRGTTQFPANRFSCLQTLQYAYTIRQCLLYPFCNAAPVEMDICLNGKRLTADDLFSLAENSILKKTRSSLLISFMIQVCLSCSDIHSL